MFENCSSLQSSSLELFGKVCISSTYSYGIFNDFRGFSHFPSQELRTANNFILKRQRMRDLIYTFTFLNVWGKSVTKTKEKDMGKNKISKDIFCKVTILPVLYFSSVISCFVHSFKLTCMMKK